MNKKFVERDYVCIIKNVHDFWTNNDIVILPVGKPGNLPIFFINN